MAKYNWKSTYVMYASPEDVFEAFTDPGIIELWGGGLSVVESTVGGKFELFDDVGDLFKTMDIGMIFSR